MSLSGKKLAFVFPGQGSQFVGMASDYAKHDVVKRVFDEASVVLGYDLLSLVEEGPKEKLDETVYSQPALLAMEIALLRFWESKTNVRPLFLAGHSLGEYAALVCSGVFSFKDAISLVSTRGRLMQEAVEKGVGKMAAIIGLRDSEIVSLCEEASEGEIISPANYNSVGQTVLSGSASAVKRAVELAKKKYNAKIAVLLKVSVPSHCDLMKPIAKKFLEKLDQLELNKPEIPVVNNVDVTVYEDVEKIKDALVRQLYCPVRWVETVQFFSNEKLDFMVECGPGKVLAGLNKRIIKDIETINISELVDL